MNTIDITLTWEGLVPVFLALIENSTPKGRANAIAELTRMAKIADMAVAASKVEAVPPPVAKDQAIYQAYRDAAREQHQEDGVCEIDEGALVSLGDDPGAYVAAWVWVSAADAGITDCEKCGVTFIEGDDSYCGTCADCADKEDAE